MLDPNVLSASLLDVLLVTGGGYRGRTADADAIARTFAQAFDAYGSGAIDKSGDGVTGAHPDRCAGSLRGTILGCNSPASAAAAFCAAFSAYWMGATFATLIPLAPAFAKETSSIVGATNTALLLAELSAEFAALSADAATKAQALASIFHRASTTAVLCVISGIDPKGSAIITVDPIH